MFMELSMVNDRIDVERLEDASAPEAVVPERTEPEMLAGSLSACRKIAKIHQ
jgi:hypothetical protein